MGTAARPTLDDLLRHLREVAREQKRLERAARRQALGIHQLLDQIYEELARRGIQIKA